MGEPMDEPMDAMDELDTSLWVKTLEKLVRQKGLVLTLLLERDDSVQLREAVSMVIYTLQNSEIPKLTIPEPIMGNGKLVIGVDQSMRRPADDWSTVMYNPARYFRSDFRVLHTIYRNLSVPLGKKAKQVLKEHIPNECFFSQCGNRVVDCAHVKSRLALMHLRGGPRTLLAVSFFLSICMLSLSLFLNRSNSSIACTD